MYNNFDYQKAIEKIKSALYDIYEHQEIMVGEEQDDVLKNKRVEKYIKVKDLAVQLLEDIESLYIEDNEKNIVENNDSTIVNIEDIKPQIIQETKQDQLLRDTEETENDSSEENSESNIDIEKEDDNDNNNDNEQVNIDLPRFYLDDRNGDKPNFAYVPNSIYINLKENAILELTNNKFFKQDSDKKRGIIVRQDQFMKLSLSKDRQEGVLKEAKEYRIMTAKKSRKKLQEIE